SPSEIDAGVQRIQVTRLVRLRWLEVLAQLLTIGFVSSALRIRLPLDSLFLLLLVGCASNAALSVWAHGASRISPRFFALALTLDVALLTLLLMLTGGSFNPFSSL